MPSNPSLEDALAALEDEVHEQLSQAVASGATTQTELKYRAQDYRTWQRMGEAPAHVHRLAENVAPSLPRATKSELVAELTELLARLHESTVEEYLDGSGRPEIAANRDDGQP